MSSDPTSAPAASPPWSEIQQLLDRAGVSKLVSIAVDPAASGLGQETTHAAELAALDSAAGCEAILIAATDRDLPGDSLPVLHQHLSAKGRLMIWGNWDSAKSTGGPEPAGHDTAVRQLSEGGFSIIEELLLEPGSSTDATHRRDSLIVARPETSTVRGYQPGDEAAILECFRTCFRVERSPEQWRWKYLDNPYGGPLISLAFEHQELLAQYAGYPSPLRLASGQSALAVQMGDTMTSPAARSVGRRSTSLLRRAVRHFFASFSDPQAAFYYGFNTGAIHRFSQRFVRGERHSAVGFWRRDTSPPPKARHRYRVEGGAQVDDAFDRLWRRTSARYGVLLQRDARYLGWRYLACPDIDYRIFAARRWGRLVGWGVFRRQGSALVWGDALFDPRHRDAAGEVLRAALEWSSRDEVGEVTAWFPEHPGWWRRTVEDLGFVRRPEPQDLALVYRPHAASDIQQQLESLYYTMGDSDLF